MIRLATCLVTCGLLAGPAVAQEWGNYFNMGTFGAGGGSVADGLLNFECPGEGSGLDSAGQPYIAITPMAGVRISKKALPAEVTFWVGDDQSYVFPMSLGADGTGMEYEYSPATVQSVRDYVHALRAGNRTAAYLDGTALFAMDLDGSGAALEFIEECIAGD